MIQNNDQTNLLDEENQGWLKLSFQVGESFTPATPIDGKILFSGREKQLNQLVNAVCQRGQHVVMYGERGVGKTSLANVIADSLEGIGKTILAPRINCDSSDNFSKVWKKVFKEIQVARKMRSIGFQADEAARESIELITYADMLEEVIGPHDVRLALQELSKGSILIIIIDEFDRIEDERVKNQFSDSIKALSDYSVSATLVIVGVADTVIELIQNHESIERSLIQINVPRMTEEEMEGILGKGLDRLGMTIDTDAKNKITSLSRGLPHYAHLLGLNSAKAAIEYRTFSIGMQQLDLAIEKTVEDAQQSIREAYYQATKSSRKENISSFVLLACALAKTDEYGYFFASDVREMMLKIRGKEYEFSYFSRQLHKLCEATRGSVLQKAGEKGRTNYRFKNPLLQPYVIMRGPKPETNTLF